MMRKEVRGKGALPGGLGRPCEATRAAAKVPLFSDHEIALPTPVSSADDFGAKAAAGFYLLLFPMFFFYHLLAAAGAFPMFLAGWWGPWSLAAAASLGVLFIAGGFYRAAKARLAFFALSAIIIADAAYHFAFGAPWQRDPRLLVESVELVAIWLGLLGVGYFLRPSRSLNLALVLGWITMAVLTIALMDPRTLTFIAVDRFHAPQVADYQGFAQAFSFTTLALLGLARQRWIRIAALAASVPVLFVLASKADLVGMALVFAAWVAVKALRGPDRLRTIGAAVAIMLVTTIVIVGAGKIATAPAISPVSGAPVAAATASIADNRQAELLAIDESATWRMRVEYLKSGLADIGRSPFFGVYDGQVKAEGEFGRYIHSMLEMWRSFGLVPFLLYAGLSFWALWSGLRRVVVEHSDESLDRLLFYSSVFCVALIIGIKSIYWQLPALTWGLALRAALEPRPSSGSR